MFILQVDWAVLNCNIGLVALQLKKYATASEVWSCPHNALHGSFMRNPVEIAAIKYVFVAGESAIELLNCIMGAKPDKACAQFRTFKVRTVWLRNACGGCQVLERLFRNIEPLEELLAFRLCMIYLDCVYFTKQVLLVNI